MAQILANVGETFFIEFLYQREKFIVNDDGLSNNQDFKDILIRYDKYEIKSIKVFNSTKGKFERISKADILHSFRYNTETSEYLKNHSFFKNKYPR